MRSSRRPFGEAALTLAEHAADVFDARDRCKQEAKDFLSLVQKAVPAFRRWQWGCDDQQNNNEESDTYDGLAEDTPLLVGGTGRLYLFKYSKDARYYAYCGVGYTRPKSLRDWQFITGIEASDDSAKSRKGFSDAVEKVRALKECKDRDSQCALLYHIPLRRITLATARKQAGTLLRVWREFCKNAG